MAKKIKKTKKKPGKKIKKGIRRSAKRVLRRATPKAIAPKPIGVITHFYGGLRVVIAKFKKPVKLGARLHYKGATTDFTEAVGSLQYDHAPIKIAPKGKQVGIKVSKKAREGDLIYEAK